MRFLIICSLFEFLWIQLTLFYQINCLKRKMSALRYFTCQNIALILRRKRD